MTAEIHLRNSIKGNAGGGTLSYYIRKCPLYADAKALLLATAPALFNDVPLANYTVDQLVSGWNFWECQAQYSLPQITPPQEKAGNIFVSWQTTGGSIHVTQSLQTINSGSDPTTGLVPNTFEWKDPGSGLAWVNLTGHAVPTWAVETPPSWLPGETAVVGTKRKAKLAVASGPAGDDAPQHRPPYYGGAVNVTKTGVEGVDIKAIEEKYTVRLYFSEITEEQLRSITYSGPVMNSVTWRGWLPGEILYEGHDGGQEGRNNFQLSMAFSASKNRNDITAGNMTDITKLGHNYLWFKYSDVDDDDAKASVKLPIAWYEERMYQWNDFTDIDAILALAASQAEA